MSRKRAREIEVPGDVLEDILALLPAQALLRFTCINKAWCSLIRSPTFISKHLLNHRLDHAFFNLRSETSDSPDLGNMNNIIDEDSCIIGQCDGLICFMSGIKNLTNPKINFDFKANPIINFDFKANPNAALHVWNPAIRQHKVLPESNILLSPGRVGLGFGHDPKSRDYKVVRCAFYMKGLFTNEYGVEAEVYSLRTDSWRPVASSQVVLKSLPDSIGLWVCLGRFCYWTGYKQGRVSMIISFDMSNEVFRQFHLPEQVYRCRDIDVTLASNLFVWKGSLAIVLFRSPFTTAAFVGPSFRRGKVRFVDIWPLEVDIEDGSVTLKEHQDLYLDTDSLMDGDVNVLLYPADVEFLWNDDLIIRCHNKGLHISETKFKAYSISTGRIRNISLVGTYSPGTRIVGYTPSLISLLT